MKLSLRIFSASRIKNSVNIPPEEASHFMKENIKGKPFTIS